MNNIKMEEYSVEGLKDNPSDTPTPYGGWLCGFGDCQGSGGACGTWCNATGSSCGWGCPNPG